MNWGDLPAYAALGLSIVALGITHKFNQRQKKFFENQELLNKQMILPPHSRTQPIRNVAPLVWFEPGASAQPVAA